MFFQNQRGIIKSKKGKGDINEVIWVTNPVMILSSLGGSGHDFSARHKSFDGLADDKVSGLTSGFHHRTTSNPSTVSMSHNLEMGMTSRSE